MIGCWIVIITIHIQRQQLQPSSANTSSRQPMRYVVSIKILTTLPTQVADLLAPFPAFCSFARNGIALSITAVHTLPPPILDWAVELCAANMAVRLLRL